MLKKFLPCALIVCALFVNALAGPPDTGGSPEPPPCETCASASGTYVVVVVNGVPFIVWLP